MSKSSIVNGLGNAVDQVCFPPRGFFQDLLSQFLSLTDLSLSYSILFPYYKTFDSKHFKFEKVILSSKLYRCSGNFIHSSENYD